MTEAGWTGNAPTKEGWYWWRNLLTDNEPEVWAIVDHGDGLEVIGPFDETALDEWVSDMGGEWLGPITPDSYQQGRVAGIKAVRRKITDLMDRGFTDYEEDMDDLIEWTDFQLAQQAQDERGVGDAGN